jgi:hypothetical protein
MMMELQKDEARDAPVKPAKLLQLLQDMYGSPTCSVPGVPQAVRTAVDSARL